MTRYLLFSIFLERRGRGKKKREKKVKRKKWRGVSGLSFITGVIREEKVREKKGKKKRWI